MDSCRNQELLNLKQAGAQAVLCGMPRTVFCVFSLLLGSFFVSFIVIPKEKQGQGSSQLADVHLVL